MTDSPEALLRSALEKIVYFEARSTQLSNDLNHARVEAERLRADLGSASQREIELRRVIAELEVRATRAHSEREETARVAEALRRERAELIGKMLEASRIHNAGDELPSDFDLARFIAELRSEVLFQREGQAVHVGAAAAQAQTAPEAAPRDEKASPAVTMAGELRTQGRLDVSSSDMERLQGARQFPGHTEETLFGFSVRELSAPDTRARVRAAERLKALAHPAAAPALAAALNSESEPSVLVALLGALSCLANAEGVAVVQPHLTSKSPEVRVAALKTLLALDATHAAPHLAAATKDPDKAVRRRASLLALGLRGPSALQLGAQAVHDEDADVRALAALVLGASGAESARPYLIDAMRDPDLRVRRAASQALSRVLGQDVSALVNLDESQRRREVRRLVNVPANPVLAKSQTRVVARAPVAAPVTQLLSQAPAARAAAPVVQTATPRAPQAAPSTALGAMRQSARVAVLEVEAPVSGPPPEVVDGVMRELRAAIRGRPLDELARGIGAELDATLKACTALLHSGQVVRRGHKYFVA